MMPRFEIRLRRNLPLLPILSSARRLRRRADERMGGLRGTGSNFKTCSPVRQAHGGLEKDEGKKWRLAHDIKGETPEPR